MKHAYWSVKCKTPECPSVIVSNYIGQYEGEPRFMQPELVPDSVELMCTACGTPHTYTTDDLRVATLPHPPKPKQ